MILLSLIITFLASLLMIDSISYQITMITLLLLIVTVIIICVDEVITIVTYWLYVFIDVYYDVSVIGWYCLIVTKMTLMLLFLSYTLNFSSFDIKT